MSEPSAATAASGPTDGGRTRPGRRAATILGLLLLAAAVAFVAGAGDRLAGARAALASPDPLAITAMLAAVAVNLLLTGAFFRLLYARHARIGMLEMQAVMAAASLLNYLPLRPGLAGRVAYHRAVHGVPVRSSVLVLVQALVLSGGLAAAVAAAAWDSAAGHLPLEAGLGVLVVGAAAMLVLRRAAEARRPRLAAAIGPWPVAALLRLGELACVALRTWAAFTLVGQPITPAVATALAAAAVFITMVPLSSNGLGLREWATGLLAPALAGVPMEPAIAADLLARAAELLVVGAAGGVSLAWLGRRGGRGGRGGHGDAAGLSLRA